MLRRVPKPRGCQRVASCAIRVRPYRTGVLRFFAQYRTLPIGTVTVLSYLAIGSLYLCLLLWDRSHLHLRRGERSRWVEACVWPVLGRARGHLVEN